MVANQVIAMVMGDDGNGKTDADASGYEARSLAKPADVLPDACPAARHFAGCSEERTPLTAQHATTVCAAARSD